jgi:hypothetical protein
VRDSDAKSYHHMARAYSTLAAGADGQEEALNHSATLRRGNHIFSPLGSSINRRPFTLPWRERIYHCRNMELIRMRAID